MIDEKTMVADTLAGINGELTRFGEMIPQTENKQLKQTFSRHIILMGSCQLIDFLLGSLAGISKLF